MIKPPPPPSVSPLTRESLSADAVRQSIRDANPQIPVWSDDQLDESLTHTLSLKPKDKDLWVFGYGSLLWNPIIDVVQRRVGTVYGYRRRFCMVAPTGRGTRAQPGLVLALDAGGCCQGAALRVNPKRIREELSLLWRREMVVGSYTPKWVKMHHAKGSHAALAFVMNRQHRSYRGALTPTQTAKTIAHATGVLGSNADYLFDTLTHLNESGLGDKPLDDLAMRVRRIHKRTKQK
ncbi:MAG: gamma-glutamylcyclotransferase [Rhodospirillaceae bacterium]|jgi:glutathione-specific gamma-glutamylcyclotransferase|nr:gamma-glutamylcyclotransferase [Rhodospirillaceae bacterium]MBT5240176.1 gamma-glutamylcyclotransferase [Rhodospirillaceae bacterium]MBT5566955.1 gamma-glutamylcyclotransferase [Rhodospirillaceae bacterium]MBT6090358.1 gamma-glutamylcyclotransferase [Rhodospirillaceae bacterium]MBT6959591.1 gamma-glutamylcyclotransferase [Rhodospirillaceae bacterium]